MVAFQFEALLLVQYRDVSWIFSISEKTMVLDMIKTAVCSKDDYYKRDIKVEVVPEENVVKLPPIVENDGRPKTIQR